MLLEQARDTRQKRAFPRTATMHKYAGFSCSPVGLGLRGEGLSRRA